MAAEYVAGGNYPRNTMYLYLDDEGGGRYAYAVCPLTRSECMYTCALLTERNGVHCCGLNNVGSFRPLTNDPEDYDD